MNYSVDISNVDKAKLLSALYNNARPTEPIGKFATYLMTVAEAGELIEASERLPANDGYMYFGAIKDRILNVNLGGDIIDAEAYVLVTKKRVSAIVSDLHMSRSGILEN